MFASIRMSAAVVAAAVLLSACSIQQTVTPVAGGVPTGTEICVVEDKSVRSGFLEAYSQALQGKGMTVRVVPSNAEGRACAMYTTYMANWRWDLAWYMAYAKLAVYRGDEKLGEAVYDSLAGGGRPDKFISAENKVNELVAQLFPS